MNKVIKVLKMIIVFTMIILIQTVPSYAQRTTAEGG
jgi:hypothetical protein